MKKILISILVTTFLFVFNLVIPTTVLSQEGPPKDKKWKGEGTVIEFQSMPTMTIKKFLNGTVPERTETIWGTLKFPANAPDKNVPVVVIMHGSGGISIWEEHWINTFNSIGLATFMVDSNWARKKCKKENKEFKKAIKLCADIHRGMNRIVDGYRALEFLSKHPRINPDRIGCLGISLGARGCLYVNVKRFQKMWGTPGLDFAASVPFYPPCNVIWKEDDEITDTPIRIHIGELDTYLPFDSCVNYVDRLKAKGKDVDIKVYLDAHHGFDAKMIFRTQSGGTTTKMKIKDHNDGRCYYEENQELTVDQIGEKSVAAITQIGFNDWLNTATEKQKNKVFKWHKKGVKFGYRTALIRFDKSCVSKSNTMAWNKEAAEEAEKLVREFVAATLQK
jgi:dienelactone hydrolase